MFGCFDLPMIANSSQQPKHKFLITEGDGEKWSAATRRGLIATVWRGSGPLGALVPAVGLTEGLLGRGVFSRSCGAAYSPAGLVRAASLSRYLHANWCHLIPRPTVARFHKFKNWRGRAPPVALSWQFDSDFIIRACFYNKRELSCLIRHARQRPLAPPPSTTAHPLTQPESFPHEEGGAVLPARRAA